jgi:hypothetical protein
LARGDKNHGPAEGATPYPQPGAAALFNGRRQHFCFGIAHMAERAAGSTPSQVTRSRHEAARQVRKGASSTQPENNFSSEDLKGDEIGNE